MIPRDIRYNVVFVVSLGIFSLVSAQSDFLRPSISMIEIVSHGDMSRLRLQPQHIPNSFDRNDIGVIKIFTGDAKTDLSKKYIERVISQYDVGSKAVLSVLPVRDGKFSNEIVKKRGVYSATDAQVNALKGTQNKNFVNIADNFGDLGIRQLDRIYVLVFHTEYYEEKDTTKELSCRARVSFFLVKIDNALKAYQKYKSNPEGLRDSHWQGKVIYKSEFRYTKSVKKYTGDKTMADLRREFSGSVQHFAFRDIIRNNPIFRPKSTLISLPKKKWAAKLGTKENLKIDNRFYVYERQLKTVEENGMSRDTVVLKRKSQLRVRYVGSNDNISDGNSDPSVFYKIGGHRIREGMFVREELGGDLGITLGYGTTNWLRIDSRIKGFFPGFKSFFSIDDFRDFSGSITIDKKVLARRLGVSEYGLEDEWDYSAFGFNFGFESAVIIGSRMQLLPFLSFGYTKLYLNSKIFYSTGYSEYKFDEKSLLMESFLIRPGVRLSLNISGSVALVGSVSYTLSWGYYNDLKYKIDGNGRDYYISGRDNFYERLILKNPAKRSGVLWDIGFRFEL